MSAVQFSRADEDRLRELTDLLRGLRLSLQTGADTATGQPLGGQRVVPVDAIEDATNSQSNRLNPDLFPNHADREEYLSLRQQKEEFEEEGMRRLRSHVKNADTTCVQRNGRHNSRGSRPTDPSANGTPLTAEEIRQQQQLQKNNQSSAWDTFKSGAYFWGSLTAMAVPGYLSKLTGGITPSRDHWHFVTDQLILGGIPILSQIGASGDHLTQIMAQIALQRPEDWSTSNRDAAYLRGGACDAVIKARAANFIAEQTKLIVGTSSASPTTSSSGMEAPSTRRFVQQAVLKEYLANPDYELGEVVACLTSDEMNGFGFKTLEFAVKVSWSDRFGTGLTYVHVPMPDATADTSMEAVRNAVDTIHATTCESIVDFLEPNGSAKKKKKGVVYIHCKAGVGRSWMVLMCYLTTYGGRTYENAYNLVRSTRTHINPSEGQEQFVKDFAIKFDADERAKRLLAEGEAAFQS